MTKKRLTEGQKAILQREHFSALHDVHGRVYAYEKEGRFVNLGVYLGWNRWYQIRLLAKNVKTEEDGRELTRELDDGLRIRQELEEAEKEDMKASREGIALDLDVLTDKGGKRQ